MAADIQVNLKAKVDAASAQAAARQMGETVQRAAGSGKSGPAGSPFAGMSGMKVSDAVALANARKAAASGGGGGGGIGAGRAAAVGGAAGAGAAIILRAAMNVIVGPMQALTNAMNRAATLYAKQLQSGGLPAGFVAQRSALAGVIGVSEDQVYQYGEAVRSLNQRLSFSSRINAETNQSVTGAAWSMRILGEDFKALAMVAANELAPSIRKAAQGMHVMIEGFGSDFMKVLTKVLKQAVKTSYAMTFGPGFVWMMKMFAGKDPGAAPAASVSSKRLQSSSWERMGLVIGQGVNSNPLKATERNTRQTAVLLKDIRAFLSPRSSATGPRLDRTAVNGA